MKTSDPKDPPKPDSGGQARQRRLAQALRDNLRRRKDAKSAPTASENDD
jgi:hypothetical protein